MGRDNCELLYIFLPDQELIKERYRIYNGDIPLSSNSVDDFALKGEWIVIRNNNFIQASQVNYYASFSYAVGHTLYYKDRGGKGYRLIYLIHMFLLIEGIKHIVKDFSVVNAKQVRPLSLILVLLSFHERYCHVLFFRDTNEACIRPDS